MVRFANQETRRFEREFAPWARDRAVATLRGLPKSQRPAFINGHHSEMENLHASFLDEREMRDINAFPEHIFVHTFPTDSTGRANTAANNEEIDVRKLSTRAAIEAVLSKQLTLSCSAVAKSGRNPGPDIVFRVANGRDVACYGASKRQKDYAPTMYPFGVILDDGCILSAYRNDAGTLQEKGRPHRKSKYDPGTKLTAIQPNPNEAIPNALEEFTRFSNYENPASMRMGRDLNEFVVSKTSTSRFYINMDDPWLMGDGNPDNPQYGEHARKHLSDILHLCRQFPEMQLSVTHHGQLKPMISKDGEWFESESGQSIQALHEADLQTCRAAVVSFSSVSFDVVETHMWASGAMPAASELDFLKTHGNPRPEHLLSADADGKTALVKAVESGRARHIPEDFLFKLQDTMLPDATGGTLGDLLSKHRRSLMEEGIDEARMQMTKITPFPGGPNELTGKFSGAFAIGTTLDGGWFCTDARGSSLNAPIWHLWRKDVDALSAQAAVDVLENTAPIISSICADDVCQSDIGGRSSTPKDNILLPSNHFDSCPDIHETLNTEPAQLTHVPTPQVSMQIPEKGAGLLSRMLGRFVRRVSTLPECEPCLLSGRGQVAAVVRSSGISKS